MDRQVFGERGGKRRREDPQQVSDEMIRKIHSKYYKMAAVGVIMSN
jgi:hypothetical protein